MTDTATEMAEDVGSELAMRPGQSAWSPQQLAVLRQIGLEAAEQSDIDLFFHVCRTSGLDPFKREIYMIGRKTKVNVKEVSPDTGNERLVERYVDKFTIQVGINGFRKRARQIAELKGIKVGFEGPLWCGEDGVWRDVWPENKVPTAAKFIVFRDGEPISFVAHYSEFVQTAGNPAEPTSMWKKMPRNQTGKCAETGAYQRAFPDELGGLLFDEAAQTTVIDSDGRVEQPAKRESAGRGVSGMRAARERSQQQPAQAVAAEPEPHPDETPEESEIRKTARKKLNDGIFAEFRKLGLNGDERRGDRLVVIRGLLKAPDIESTKDLNDDQLQTLRNELVNRRQDKTIDNDVREFLNFETLRQENAAAAAAASEDGEK